MLLHYFSYAGVLYGSCDGLSGNGCKQANDNRLKEKCMKKCELCTFAKVGVCSVMSIEIERSQEVVTKQGCFAFKEREHEG